MDEKELRKHLYVLILCGGGGTRLWPRSRNKLPKQFAELLESKTIFNEKQSKHKKERKDFRFNQHIICFL